MPYIRDTARERIDPLLEPLLQKIDSSTPAGELNYIISKIVAEALDAYYADDHVVCISGYSEANKVIGVLSCVIQEIYRRLVVPHEQRALQINGDFID